jgi:hypothetical protein
MCISFPNLKEVTVLVRAVILVTLALSVAACGADKEHATPKSASPAGGLRPCKLTMAQRHAIALSEADIRRLHKIQEPLTKFSDQGTPAQERVTNKFLLDMGRTKLPINERARLLRLAKGAVGLCGQCFQGLEAAEPVLAGRLGDKRCG